ncbi:MAG: hypothetical protein EOL90_01110 [Spartobacteria bacterium]|nr:hypothetical protein [Spartobacteria bacterium]
METKRLFAGVAVAAAEPLRRALAELQARLRGEAIRWTRLDNLHLTRAFGATLANLPVGDLPAQAVRELVLYESAAGRYVPLATWPLGRKTLGSRSGIARKRGRALPEPQPQLIGPPPNVL